MNLLHRPFSAALVAALFITAPALCQTMPAATQPAPTTPTITVKLLDAGSGDKKPLRYAFVKDMGATMTVTTTIEASATVGGQAMPAQKMPPMTTNMATKIADVETNGDAHVEVSYANANPNPTSAVTGKALVSNRGLVSSFDLDVAPDAPPAVRQQAETARQNSAQFFIPMPEEAVGVGAKWEVSQTLRQQGMVIEQALVYTLKSRTGDVVELEVEFKQTGAEQDVENPQFPGVKLHLNSFNSTGKGQAKVELDSVLCAANKFDMTTDMSMTMPQIGDVSQHMQASMTGASARTPPAP